MRVKEKKIELNIFHPLRLKTNKQSSRNQYVYIHGKHYILKLINVFIYTNQGRGAKFKSQNGKFKIGKKELRK
jgi:hypothetical protein